ncbi:HAMP domain-containing sensor histidine kinase [Luteococcus sp. H138]|uniref:HAMP domain-containing sensor histidine kinase n=1 Tax=unclassified Luteococcus TaxID=2639923 RepID=UPI00313C3B8E
MFVVLVLTMLGVGVVTDAVFMNRQINEMEGRLNASAAHAQTLAREPITPEDLVEHLARGNMQASVLTADGRVVGAPRPAERTRFVTDPLDANGVLRGAEVTVWESTDSIVSARRTLDASLLLVGLLGIVGASLLTIVITDVALKPLEVMADRANRIKEGERGIRMAAPHETSEVGRTAAAVDGMLDELEGAEIRARAAEAQARASAEQMQGFLSDAAHELKTPMAGIQAAAESLIQLPEDAHEEREQLAFLLGREANRGGHLVNSLLEAARVDAGPRLSLELLDLADLALAEQRRISLVHPRLEVLIQGRNQLVRADRQGITSVLRNLVDNAARAAGPEGWMVIDLSSDRRGGADMAVLRVTDSGPGIPVEDRERVFDRLVRLSSTATTTKGSGLGLSIARGYARAHGGDVVYVADAPDLPLDEEGRPRRPGACFEVCLPLARKAAPVAAQRLESTA